MLLRAPGCTTLPVYAAKECHALCTGERSSDRGVAEVSTRTTGTDKGPVRDAPAARPGHPGRYDRLLSWSLDGPNTQLPSGGGGAARPEFSQPAAHTGRALNTPGPGRSSTAAEGLRKVLLPLSRCAHTLNVQLDYPGAQGVMVAGGRPCHDGCECSVRKAILSLANTERVVHGEG